MVVSPDCRDKNHTKCDGVAWDEQRDEPTACQCRDLTHGSIDDPHDI